MKNLFRPFLTYIGLALAALATGCGSDGPEPSLAAGEEHLALGNPSGATTNVAQPTNYLLLKPEYALSYHRTRGIPNWVSWHLETADMGSAARQDDFRPDNTLPASWYQVMGSSYSSSGFDRGHHCPSADRTATTAANSATFLMTNMLPQAPNLNQRTWAGLEEYCRKLARAGSELYIVMGSYGAGGTGSQGMATTLDQGRVTVPARVWKVVVVLPTGKDDATRVTNATRVIAVDVPNQNTVSAAWGGYRTSVDAIEAATGLDLLSAVKPAVQSTLEAQTDNGPTQ
ncbi:DNA/RNA non-specific endonuclease [Hymenobacter tibetensis]|uniref:DNA/RNA non-specific endonuclease n=1 Tax=Hymenobacter tibetensis TaxID=497967 RepID=A0ABY4D9R0_9BACT|nr:DNA/RNA non-specific endonuclease [Hymenobacter tibetensis]UOG76823.1 DNA/RNA non-specific endonuclease [Hymenobacter tibetensis]